MPETAAELTWRASSAPATRTVRLLTGRVRQAVGAMASDVDAVVDSTHLQDATDPEITRALAALPRDPHGEMPLIAANGGAFGENQAALVQSRELAAWPAAHEEEPAEPTVVPPQPASWSTRWTISTTQGTSSLDVALTTQAPAEGEWGLVLTGRVHDLELRLMMFRGRRPAGEVGVQWRHTPRVGAVATRLSTVAFVEALHGDGTLLIEDLDGRIGSQRLDWHGTDPDERLAFERAFFADVVLIEQWTVHEVVLPEHAPSEHVQGVAQAAAMIRDRRVPLQWTALSMTLPESEVPDQGETDALWIEQPLRWSIFDHATDLGRYGAEFHYRVRRRLAQDDGQVRVTAVPADPTRASLTAELVPPAVEATQADPFQVERAVSNVHPDDLLAFLRDHLGSDLADYVARQDAPVAARNDVMMVLRRAAEATDYLVDSYGDETARLWLTTAKDALDEDTPADVLRSGDARSRNLVVALARETAASES